MTDTLITSVVTIATAIIGVAILATLVSRNSQTPAVLQAAGSAFSGALGTALGPITGSSSITGGGTFAPAYSFPGTGTVMY